MGSGALTPSVYQQLVQSSLPPFILKGVLAKKKKKGCLNGALKPKIM